MLLKSIVVTLLFIVKTVQADVIPAEKHLFQVVAEQVKKECGSCKIEMNILNKKILADIAMPDKVFADHWRGQTNLVLQLGNENRIVTAHIRWFDKVVVAKKNIRLGHNINNEDIRIVDKDVTYIKEAYLVDPKHVEGLVSRRVFQRGHVIDEAFLKKPLVVRYGQALKVELRTKGLRLEMRGQAKGAGAIGDRIPIQIKKTRKKMMAKIVGQNRVRVE